MRWHSPSSTDFVGSVGDVVSRISVFGLVLILFFAYASVAQAEDLPIDITAVGQQEGYDDAVTSRDTELLTADAESVSEAIEEHQRLKREELTAGLFETSHVNEAVDMRGQVMNVADDSTLFSKPANYIGKGMADSGTSISAWIVIVLFAACGAGGFAIAYGLLMRRKRQGAGVH